MTGSAPAQIRMQMFFSKYVTSPRLHGLLYRVSGGRVGSRLPGVKPDVLLLNTRGRRTGTPRGAPLVWFRIDGQIVVAATNNGKDRHPDWYWNLIADSEPSVQIGVSRTRVRPRIAKGRERARPWARISEVHPLFEAYQEGTDRKIPVIVLEPLS